MHQSPPRVGTPTLGGVLLSGYGGTMPDSQGFDGLLVYIPLGIATAVIAAVVVWIRHENNKKG